MKVIDLFAGAGGFSQGAKMAGYDVVWAANHWEYAVGIHQLNHPNAAHQCQDLHLADWTQVPDHDGMLASPSCTGHTPARGEDKPHHDAARSTAWCVVSAAEVKRPKFVVVENVPAFIKWTLYPAWCSAMQALGYAVSPHTVDCADHGVAQHRVRLFIVLTRSRHPLVLDLQPEAHIPASNVIDFDSGTWSKINKPGRSPATLARIKNGRKQFGDRFVAPFYGSGSGTTGRSIDRPIGTLTTKDRWAVIDGNWMRMVNVAEGRRFMGFPDTYILPEKKDPAMMMLGNAVPPPAACKVLTTLRAAA